MQVVAPTASQGGGSSLPTSIPALPSKIGNKLFPTDGKEEGSKEEGHKVCGLRTRMMWKSGCLMSGAHTPSVVTLYLYLVSSYQTKVTVSCFYIFCDFQWIYLPLSCPDSSWESLFGCLEAASYYIIWYLQFTYCKMLSVSCPSTALMIV